MPDLTSTVLGNNYRKMTPTTTTGGEYYSNFGTRQLAWFKVALAGLNNSGNFTAADSLFSKAVRGLQLNTEVYFISSPVDTTTDYFVVAVAFDTTPDDSKEDQDNDAPTQAELIADIVNRATTLSSTVTNYTF